MLTSARSADAPSSSYFKTKVYYAPSDERARAAATPMANLFAPADVEPLPPAIRAISPRKSMLVVVVGSTSTARSRRPCRRRRPSASRRASAPTRRSRSSGAARARKLPFKAMVPSAIETTSQLSTMQGARLYYVEGRQKALRLTFVTGAEEYWGIEESDWADAPILSKPSQTQKLKDGRTYDLYYNGSHLHMVVLRGAGTRGTGS